MKGLFITERGATWPPEVGAPNLAEMVAKYQAFLAPEDPRFGEGIAGWDITSEYVTDPKSESDGTPIWGCMCSPSVLASEGKRVKLQPADIAAKRAHIVVRTPTNRNELIEIERTVMHELGHVLHAKLNLPRDAEEEIMHSLDHFFSKLSPEQGQILARSFQNPMARAYRAKEGNMPDPIVEDKPDKEAPKMAEGAPRDVAAITADIVKAILGGQPIEELGKELVMAQALAGAAGAAPAPAAPIEPTTMGMKPDDAYTRAKRDADKAAVKVLVDNLPTERVDEKQKKYLHGRASIAEVNEALEAMPRAQTDKVITLAEHPAGKGKKEDPFAREMAAAENDPVMRAALNIGSTESDGVMYDVPGRIVYVDGTENLRYQRAKYRAKREKAMTAS